MLSSLGATRTKSNILVLPPGQPFLIFYLQFSIFN